MGCSRAGAEGRVLPEEGGGQGAPGFQEKGEGGVLQVSRRRGRAESTFQEKGEGGSTSFTAGQCWAVLAAIPRCVSPKARTVRSMEPL